MAMSTVLIGGDVCPIGDNEPYFARGDVAVLLNDLRTELDTADLVVVNLETPLIDRPTPVLKTGPVFGVRTECIRGIKQSGIDILGLANNHIMDHGEEGLRRTLEACRMAGVATVGAGSSRAEARRILIRCAGEVRVGILAVAENEFSIAGSASWGANPLDVIDCVRNIQERRSEFDHLVVLLHGSAEFHVPTPRIQETCRFLIEQGAHTVVVQHPHVVGGMEEHRGGRIFYGQGAFMMDEPDYRETPSFHEGYLVKLIFEGRNLPRWELVPFRQSSPVPGARRLSEAEETLFRSSFAAKVADVSEPGKVGAAWEDFCQQHEHRYLSTLLGHGWLARNLNAQGALERWFYSPRILAGVRNVVCCETHQEAIRTLFRLRGF